jgi:hypothetical protein
MNKPCVIGVAVLALIFPALSGAQIPPEAQLAFERGQYTEALQQLVPVMVTADRNAEWFPAALFLEGLIYQKTGQTEAAAYTADELSLGWPDSVWGRRAAELKGLEKK